jgi:hypothetical protein
MESTPDSGLWHHFQMGGWAMYPIFVLGLLGVAAAARFAWRGEHQLLQYLRWHTLTVISCGLFGFFAGMIRASQYIAYRVPADKALVTLIEGLGEALNNVTAALLFTVLVCLLTAIGFRRFPLPNPSAVAR